MSNYYHVTVVFPSKNDYVKRVTIESDVESLVDGGLLVEGDTSPEKLREMSKKVFHDGRENGICFRYRGISCRESVVYHSEAYYNLASYVDREFYYPPVVFVTYYKKNGYALRDSHIKLIAEFGDIFFKQDEIRVFTGNPGQITLACAKTIPNTSLFVYDISLFLWIIRNEQILENLVNRFRGNNRSVKFLFEYLSREFLMNENWGDTYNSNLGLSLYCYQRSVEKTIFRSFAQHTGPVDASLSTDLSVLVSYIKNVFIPSGGFNSHLNLDYADQGFVSGLQSIMKAYQTTEIPTEKQVEKVREFVCEVEE